MNAIIPLLIKESDSKECIVISDKYQKVVKEIVSILKKYHCTISQSNEIFKIIIAKLLNDMSIPDIFMEEDAR